MTRLDTLTSNLALESTIDNILANTEKNILTSIKSGLDESRQKLDSSISLLEAEYDKIISDGKKKPTSSKNGSSGVLILKLEINNWYL